MRSSIEPRPRMYSVSSAPENSGAGLICWLCSVSTSDTPSTTMPTTRSVRFRMMTTVYWLYSTRSSSNLMRRSTIGTMIPRRLITPLMNSGALAMRVTVS